jgi:hypothetical protein
MFESSFALSRPLSGDWERETETGNGKEWVRGGKKGGKEGGTSLQGEVNSDV